MHSLRFKKLGTFSRVPDTATDPSEREDVCTVNCSDVYAPVSTVYGVSKQWQERANWAQSAQGKMVYTDVPSEDMRFTVDEQEYRVRDFTAWPDNEPEYYEILLEKE